MSGRVPRPNGITFTRVSLQTVFVPIAMISSACGLTSMTAGATGEDTRIQRLWQLQDESVFAYSRVSGDGRYLVYSFTKDGDDTRRGVRRLRVVDLWEQRSIHEDFGIDGYWSPDGSRLIYKAQRDDGSHVAIWNRDTAALTLDVFPTSLGDYFSWGGAGNAETIMTIDGWYLSVVGAASVASPQRMPVCPGIGRGARPLISRDGDRVSVFVGDELVVRNVRDCSDIVFTGLAGAKADWSRGGRFLAFHAATRSQAYEIGVYDTRTGSYKAIPTPGASSLFPSWTDDDALVFRYDGTDYHGFVRVDPAATAQSSERPTAGALADFREPLAEWQHLLPRQSCVLVLLWASWGAHSYDALAAFEAAQRASPDCAFVSAHDPTSARDAVHRVVEAAHYGGIVLRAPWNAIRRVGGFNQTPTYVLFLDGRLSDRVLGTLGAPELLAWLRSSARPAPDDTPAAHHPRRRPARSGEAGRS